MPFIVGVVGDRALGTDAGVVDNNVDTTGNLAARSMAARTESSSLTSAATASAAGFALEVSRSSTATCAPRRAGG